MKRTARNALAIAAMAGGMLFLGQAVASADDGAGNVNDSNNQSFATNTNVTDVETDVEGGDGGSNSASVNTGAVIGGGGIVQATTSSAPQNGGGSVEVHTGDVKVSQEANGGDVSHSGNVHVSGGPTQTATATADTAVHQSATSEGGHGNGSNNSSYMSGGGETGNLNDSNNQSFATNTNVTDIETDIEGGDGGYNSAEVNTGLILSFGFLGAPDFAASSNSSSGYEGGGFDVRTGDVYVHQEANGGDVHGSGNVWVTGGAHQTATANATTTVRQRARSEEWGGAGNLNWSNNQAFATNSNVTYIDTDIEGGDGGANFADANTGAIVIFGFFGYAPLNSSAPEHGGSGVEVHTGDVYVHQEANGGDVSKSGNVWVKGGAHQTATAHATTAVHQTARSEGDWWHHCRKTD